MENSSCTLFEFMSFLTFCSDYFPIAIQLFKIKTDTPQYVHTIYAVKYVRKHPLLKLLHAKD